LIQIYLTSI